MCQEHHFYRFQSSYKITRPVMWVLNTALKALNHANQILILHVCEICSLKKPLNPYMEGRSSRRPIHGWGTTQRREWIFDELRNRFCKIFATDSWHLALAIWYLHALIQEGPYICNHSVMYTPLRWYLRESHHKCSHMCSWRDVDMQRIIDEPWNRGNRWFTMV